MSEQYKEGDTVRFTITGKVERVRGDAVVISAHGISIPCLASQIKTQAITIEANELWHLLDCMANLFDLPANNLSSDEEEKLRIIRAAYHKARALLSQEEVNKQ